MGMMLRELLAAAAFLVVLRPSKLVLVRAGQDLSEDEQVLRELGLFDDEEEGDADTLDGASEMSSGNGVEEQLKAKKQSRSTQRMQTEEEDREEGDLFDPSSPAKVTDYDSDIEDDGDDYEKRMSDYEDRLEAGSGQGSQKKPLKESLSEEYFKLKTKHNSDFFDGAMEYLERIVLQARGGQEAIGPMSVLGFHYVLARDYELCAGTFETVHEVMGDRTQGPALLADFCSRMANGASSLSTLADAIPLLRLSATLAKRELDGEKAKVLTDLLAELGPRLQGGAVAATNVQWYVHGLEANPFYSPERFPAAAFLEKHFKAIRAEVDAFLNGPSVSVEMRPMGEHTGPSDASLVTKGSWTDVSLFKGGVRDQRICKKFFPETCGVIEEGLPEAWTNNYCQVIISQLTPGTESESHQGGTNAQLSFHLGLLAPPGAGIKVADKVLEPGWQEGKVIVFDDSLPHQVWHRGEAHEGPRVVLVLRVWHPSFSLRERLDVIQQDDFKMGNREVKKRTKHLQSPSAVRRYEDLLAAFRNPVSSSSEPPLQHHAEGPMLQNRATGHGVSGRTEEL